jgi:hypothetical protein
VWTESEPAIGNPPYFSPTFYQIFIRAVKVHRNISTNKQHNYDMGQLVILSLAACAAPQATASAMTLSAGNIVLDVDPETLASAAVALF